MRFRVSDWFDLEHNYRSSTWVKPGVIEQRTDIYRFFMLDGTLQEFDAAARHMRRPDLRSRLRSFWSGIPLVPYAAIWRDENICMELEIGAVCLQRNVSLLFFGQQDQVRIDDEIELLSIELRRHDISTSVVVFTKRNVLPLGSIWGTEWGKNR